MPPPIAPAARLRAELDRLADEVAGVGFGMAGADQEGRRHLAGTLIETVRSYLIPRLGDPEAPLLVAVVGPTGSGKSTVVSSLAGRPISPPGAVRPTTRAPVVWCHHRHAGRYHRIGSVACEVVPDDHPLLEGLAIADTPDLDSYLTHHRHVAGEILARADVALFLTSAQRYADAVPWEVLREIDRRGTIIVHVLNRLGRRSAGAVSDYAGLLRRHGLSADPLLTIQEQRVRGESGLLPAPSVRKVEAVLRRVAGEHAATLAGVTERVVGHVVERARHAAEAVDDQHEEQLRLQAVVDDAYRAGLEELVGELERGSLIESEVVDRWSERVGVGELARWVRGSVSWARAVVERFTGQAAAVVAEVEREARREIADAVHARLDRSARAVATGWELDLAGRALLSDDLRRASGGSRGEVEEVVERWMADVTRMVEAEGPGRFRTARVVSTGINVAAVATVVALLASTGGLTGAEAGVAAGAAAAQQAALEHLFGKAAAASLTGAARRGLTEGLAGVFGNEAGRYHQVLMAASDPPERAEALRRAAQVVEVESERFHAA